MRSDCLPVNSFRRLVHSLTVAQLREIINSIPPEHDGKWLVDADEFPINARTSRAWKEWEVKDNVIQIHLD